MTIQSPVIPKENWADNYLENAKNRFKNAKSFWKRNRDESYKKLLFTTYHPNKLIAKFFKSIGRIIKGVFLFVWAVFNKPLMTIPKILSGFVLEILALLMNIFNVFIFLIPQIICGIIWGIILNLVL